MVFCPVTAFAWPDHIFRINRAGRPGPDLHPRVQFGTGFRRNKLAEHDVVIETSMVERPGLIRRTTAVPAAPLPGTAQVKGVTMSDRSLRGMRLGAQSMETESGVEPAPRQRVEYRCADGEQVFVMFSAEAEIPPVWVSKTGKEALLVDGEKPVDSNEKAVRTHWDMLLERRTMPELEQILEDRLKILRERRGERRSA
jgi:hypothetical protein